MTDEEADAIHEAELAALDRLYAAEPIRRVLDAPAYPYCGVYFLRAALLVKIGLATNVPVRLAELQKANAGPVTPFGWIRCGSPAEARALEQSLHAQFHAQRAHGEWFRLTDVLARFIPAAITTSLWPRS